jgi:hypothetical protein
VLPLWRRDARIIAFITDGPTVRDILVHPANRPRHPDRTRPRPAAMDRPDAGPGHLDPQPAPEYEFDNASLGNAERRPPSAPPGRLMPAVAGHATRAR